MILFLNRQSRSKSTMLAHNISHLLVQKKLNFISFVLNCCYLNSDCRIFHPNLGFRRKNDPNYCFSFVLAGHYPAGYYCIAGCPLAGYCFAGCYPAGSYLADHCYAGCRLAGRYSPDYRMVCSIPFWNYSPVANGSNRNGDFLHSSYCPERLIRFCSMFDCWSYFLSNYNFLSPVLACR